MCDHVCDRQLAVDSKLNDGSVDLWLSGVIDNDSDLQDTDSTKTKSNQILCFPIRTETLPCRARGSIRELQCESERVALREAARQAGLIQRAANGKGSKSKRQLSAWQCSRG